MTKRTVVPMSDDCHAALKQYAAFYGMSMSEVLYNCTRMQFHTQAQHCQFVDDMLDKLDIPLDKRAGKECFSALCFGCKHLTACKTGVYKGVVEMNDKLMKRNPLKPSGKQIVADMQTRHGQRPQFFKEEWQKPDDAACDQDVPADAFTM